MCCIIKFYSLRSHIYSSQQSATMRVSCSSSFLILLDKDEGRSGKVKKFSRFQITENSFLDYKKYSKYFASFLSDVSSKKSHMWREIFISSLHLTGNLVSKDVWNVFPLVFHHIMFRKENLLFRILI